MIKNTKWVYNGYWVLYSFIKGKGMIFDQRKIEHQRQFLFRGGGMMIFHENVHPEIQVRNSNLNWLLYPQSTRNANILLSKKLHLFRMKTPKINKNNIRELFNNINF